MNCSNQVAENGRKKKRNELWLPKSWGGIKKKKKVLHPQHFYNIFTINHMWLVVISSNLNLTLRLLF